MMAALKLILLFNLVFILALGLYPIFAWIRSFLFKKCDLKSDAFIQPVSIIIASYNEEKYIRQKLDSFLCSDEWIDSSEIIVVSGGSTDSTNNILSEYKQNPNVKLIFEKTQISKIAAVNLAVKKAKHELLVFSDCRQKMQKGSVRQLINNFNNPEIGTVTATLIDGEKKSKVSFRNLLNFIAHCESKSGSCLNVFGALYAQRKSIFREIPNDLLFDDLFVVVSTIVQKKRLIMDEKVLLYDVPFQDYYMPDRIHRLTRGLLIFLTNQYKMILKLPVLSLFRFIIFKYFKLILPFVFVLISAVLIILYYKSIPVNVILIILCALLLPFMIKKTRQLMVHFIKINYHFLIATVQFFFFNKKSNRWEKLKVTIKETDFTKSN